MPYTTKLDVKLFTILYTSLQPFALSAEEKKVLQSLSNELFNLIPLSNDLNIADIVEGRSCILIDIVYVILTEYYCEL